MEQFIEAYELVKQNKYVDVKQTLTKEQYLTLFKYAFKNKVSASFRSMLSILNESENDVLMCIFDIVDIVSENKYYVDLILMHIFDTRNLYLVKYFIPKIVPFTVWMIEYVEGSNWSIPPKEDILEYLRGLEEIPQETQKDDKKYIPIQMGKLTTTDEKDWFLALDSNKKLLLWNQNWEPVDIRDVYLEDNILQRNDCEFSLNELFYGYDLLDGNCCNRLKLRYTHDICDDDGDTVSSEQIFIVTNPLSNDEQERLNKEFQVKDQIVMGRIITDQNTTWYCVFYPKTNELYVFHTFGFSYANAFPLKSYHVDKVSLYSIFNNFDPIYNENEQNLYFKHSLKNDHISTEPIIDQETRQILLDEASKQRKVFYTGKIMGINGNSYCAIHCGNIYLWNNKWEFIAKGCTKIDIKRNVLEYEKNDKISEFPISPCSKKEEEKIKKQVKWDKEIYQ